MKIDYGNFWLIILDVNKIYSFNLSYVSNIPDKMLKLERKYSEEKIKYELENNQKLSEFRYVGKIVNKIDDVINEKKIYTSPDNYQYVEKK